MPDNLQQLQKEGCIPGMAGTTVDVPRPPRRDARHPSRSVRTKVRRVATAVTTVNAARLILAATQ
jgi:hypothetical protein